jgi:hypothetical protein
MMPKAKDFTIAEAKAAFEAFENSIGSKCDTHVTINRHAGSLLSAQVYPLGILGKVTLYAKADTFRDLLAACEAKWAAHSDVHAANTIREMALAIIAITADQGECTDAALRARFDAADVRRFGDAACAQATEMASNGPFSIVVLAGANDAEAA